MIEDAPGDRRLGDEGDDLEAALAPGTGQHVDGEDLPQQLGRFIR
jgi:hypothetical protein